MGKWGAGKLLGIWDFFEDIYIFLVFLFFFLKRFW